MAPEQASGRTRELSPATDVYALGTILYESLTARPQFLSESVMDVLDQVRRQEPVSPRRLQPRVPRDLETICLKCLEKEPKKRYATAEALADDLRRFLNGEPIKARPTPPWERALKWARRRPALATLLVVSVVGALTLLGGSLWYSARLKTALTEREQALDQARFQVVRQYVNRSMRLAEEDNPLAALPWAARAMYTERGVEYVENMHRTRVGVLLRQCPRLEQLWFHDDALTSAEFSPDGRRAVTASKDGTARLWDVSDGETPLAVLRHPPAVRQASLDKDGRRVVTAGEDGTARIWDAATGQQLQELRHDGPVRHAFFSPDGRRLATCSDDATARVWDAATGQPVTPPLRHGKTVRYVAFSPDGSKVVTASEDNTAQVWDVPTGKRLITLPHKEEVFRAAFSPDGAAVVTGSADDTAYVWDAATGRPRVGPLQHRDDIHQASFSPDGRRVLTGSDDGTARIWDAKDGKPLTPPLEHGSAVKSAVWSADGRYVVTASDDNTARVWKAETGEPYSAPLLHAGTVQTAVLSPDGRRVLTAGDDQVARLWDISVCASPGGRIEPGARVQPQSAVSPDGRRQLRVQPDGSAAVIDIASRRALTPPLRHGSTVRGGVFSPDGEKVVTYSEDNTARVWRADDGTPLTPPLRHTGSVLDAAFSPHSGWLVTASTDQTARVWNIGSGQAITPPLRHPKSVEHVSFGRDEHEVITACKDGKTRVWDLPADDRPAEDLLLLARLLSGGQVDEKSGGFVAVEPATLRRLWEDLRAKYPDDFGPRRQNPHH
jgi:WD40 repeat protein